MPIAQPGIDNSAAYPNPSNLSESGPASYDVLSEAGDNLISETGDQIVLG